MNPMIFRRDSIGVDFSVPGLNFQGFFFIFHVDFPCSRFFPVTFLDVLSDLFRG